MYAPRLHPRAALTAFAAGAVAMLALVVPAQLSGSDFGLGAGTGGGTPSATLAAPVGAPIGSWVQRPLVSPLAELAAPAGG